MPRKALRKTKNKNQVVHQSLKSSHQVREPSQCHVHGHRSKRGVGRGDKLCTDLVMMMVTLLMVMIALPHHAKTQQARSGRGEA